MSAIARVEVECPHCEKPIGVDVHADTVPLRAVDGPLVVKIHGEVFHSCQTNPPRGRAPLRRAA